jgi:hypothetical protein
MKKLVTAGLSILALLIGSFAPAMFASAQANTNGQALEIAPPVVNLTADPGQTIKTQISLRDVSKGKLVVKGQVNDFVASGEDGTPKILLEDNDSNPYSLKKWISPLPELLLNPKQIENLPVTIKVPMNASPGGYYGVIRFTATPPELDGNGVSLSASLGALVLLKVNGNVKENLSIEEFSMNSPGKSGSLFESTPLQFVERIKNTGNMHEQPTGQITITDMFGKKVATVNINLPPRNILPQSIRKFEQSLDSSVLGDKKLFGKYTAELRVTYGANNQVVTSSKTFWVIPYTLIGIIILLVVGGFITLRILIKRYNRHIIKKAQKSHRK